MLGLLMLAGCPADFDRFEALGADDFNNDDFDGGGNNGGDTDVLDGDDPDVGDDADEPGTEMPCEEANCGCDPRFPAIGGNCEGGRTLQCSTVTNTVECLNECGGPGPLAFDGNFVILGDKCGPCSDGRYACGEGDVVCADANEKVSMFRDEDNDGWGSDEAREVCLNNPGLYTAERSGDCNDDPNSGGADVNPDQPEVCDFIDNDCQNGVDNDGVITNGLHNSCGGCTPLDGEPGMACGEQCEGSAEYRCDGRERVTCVTTEGTINPCGGCEEFPNGEEPGDPCGECGIMLCDSLDEISCHDTEVETLGQVCNEGLGACRAEGVIACSYVDDEPVARCNAQPGMPSNEACDMQDNDCDGRTDEDEEGFPLTEIFYTGPEETRGVGLCREGVRVCVNGDLEVTTPQQLPADEEVCDTLDNTCDGNTDVDEDLSPLSRSYYNGEPDTEGVGACQSGLEVCQDGNFVVDQEDIIPVEEICNDEIDNNCDGVINESCECEQEGQSRDCGIDPQLNGIGICHFGTQTCDNNNEWGPCENYQGPREETCNRLDDDCDGEPDDGIAPEPSECGEGQCFSTGQVTCEDGAFVDSCRPGSPSDEICDERDNNCNGEADEGLCPLRDNANNACNQQDGCDLFCFEGFIDLDGEEESGCEYECTPTDDNTEICDTLDNDCDGNIEVGICGINEPCAGVEACLEGLVCLEGLCGPEGYVFVPAGTFQMGSPEDELGHETDELRHTVTLTRSFLIKSFEVTQREWLTLSGEGYPGNPSQRSNCLDCPVDSVNFWETIAAANQFSIDSGLEPCYENERENIYSWNDVLTDPFWPTERRDCLGFRLPIEAEWEYAARASTTTPWWCGQEASCLPENGVIFQADTTENAESGEQNDFGLLGTSGNVDEWVFDCYRPFTAQPVTDPLGLINCAFRVRRGGNFRSQASEVRSASRDTSRPQETGIYQGFRLVRTLPGQ